MGNAIQRPKEQTSFDRKEDKAGSTCLNERGSHPTSPSNLTFLLIAIDTNGFRRMKEEGLIYKVLPQIF